jgi:hypothetical protein
MPVPRRAILAVAILASSAAGLALVATPGGGALLHRHALDNPLRASPIAQCVRARRPDHVRALAFDGARLPFDVAAGQEPGSRPRCRRGELRLLRLQALRIGAQTTYVRRGGCRRPCLVRQATVHIPASALARQVRLLPRAARNGDGGPVAGCRDQARLAPQRSGAALHRMYYKTPSELRRRAGAERSGGAGARWSNYGDPGAQYHAAGRRPTHYGYLLWNLPRTRAGLLPGGGIVEAVLPAGEPVALCRGERLSLPSFDRRGARNGRVDFLYAKVRSATRPVYAIYGWVLAGYRLGRRPYTSTTTGSTIGRRLSRL